VIDLAGAALCLELLLAGVLLETVQPPAAAAGAQV